MTNKQPLPSSVLQTQPSLPSRQEARQRRIQTLLKYLGFPSSGIGVATTFNFIRLGQWDKAALSGLLTVSVTLLAIGGKFVSEVINQVLDKIEARLEQLVDPLADWIVTQLETFIICQWWRLTSQFQGKYYQSLIYACRDYRTQGLKTKGPFTLDLEQVFVPLRITPESAERISGEMMRRDGGSQELSIWDILVASGTQPTYRSLAIIAAPGSGKTTLLEHLTLTYAKNRHRHYHKQAPKLMPILVYLREMVDAIASSDFTLAELIEQQESIRKLSPPPQWFAGKLRHRDCLVMFDGLDEVADESQRQMISSWVNQQIQDYPNTRFILTSRPFGYQSAPISSVKAILEVQPFNLQQMQQFIQNWYVQREIMSRLGKDDPGVREVANRQADDLIQRIQTSPPLAAMALNPLLLTMIATVHCYRGALPGRRVELYDEICDVLLGKRSEYKGIIEPLTAHQKKTVLQVLALGLMEQNTREFSLEQASQIIQAELAKVAGTQLTPAAFLENIENVSGLIIEREPGLYEFSHKSFQEYLAAVQIKDSHQDSLLIQNIHHDWWAETLRLYATQSNATPLIHAALDQPTVVSLKLALDCAEEGLRVDPEVREDLKQRLEAGLTSPDPAIAQLAAEVKLARRLSNFLRIDQTLEIDTSYVTYAEYHLFINALEKTGEDYKPNQESTHQFPPKEAQTPIQGLTITQKNRFCAWLNWHNSETLPNGTISHYRLPTPTEFNHYPIPDDTLRESGIRLVRYQLPLTYRQLAYLLACGQWQAANTETAQITRQIAGQENRGWLNDNDIKKFPPTDLNQIDQLWYHYSAGQFGFRVQRDLYTQVGGKPRDYNYNTYKQFSDRVGWYVPEKDEWRTPAELTFSLDAPPGHLPCGGWLDMGGSKSNQTPLFAGWAILVTLFWRI